MPGRLAIVLFVVDRDRQWAAIVPQRARVNIASWSVSGSLHEQREIGAPHLLDER